MQNNRFLEGLRRAYARYDRLMEKQGFTSYWRYVCW